VGVNELGRGQTIEWQGELYFIEAYSHMKKAQGRPVAQTKLRHLASGRVLFHNFTGSEPVKIVRLDERPLQFLYRSGEQFYFMDQESYDQCVLNRQELHGVENYLRDNLELTGLYYQDRLLKLELPLQVELEVTRTDPGVRGDTVSGGDKPAVLETGLELRVPLFIQQGEHILVDTRSGAYLSRVAGHSAD